MKFQTNIRLAGKPEKQREPSAPGPETEVQIVLCRTEAGRDLLEECWSNRFGLGSLAKEEKRGEGALVELAPFEDGDQLRGKLLERAGLVSLRVNDPEVERDQGGVDPHVVGEEGLHGFPRADPGFRRWDQARRARRRPKPSRAPGER